MLIISPPHKTDAAALIYSGIQRYEKWTTAAPNAFRPIPSNAVRTQEPCSRPGNVPRNAGTALRRKREERGLLGARTREYQSWKGWDWGWGWKCIDSRAQVRGCHMPRVDHGERGGVCACDQRVVVSSIRRTDDASCNNAVTVDTST